MGSVVKNIPFSVFVVTFLLIIFLFRLCKSYANSGVSHIVNFGWLKAQFLLIGASTLSW